MLGSHCPPDSLRANNRQQVRPKCYRPTQNQQRAETWKCEPVILFSYLRKGWLTVIIKQRKSSWVIYNKLYQLANIFRYSRLSHLFSCALWFLQHDPVVWLDLSVMVNANLWWLFSQVRSDLNTSLHKCSQHINASFFMVLRKQTAPTPCPGDNLLVL